MHSLGRVCCMARSVLLRLKHSFLVTKRGGACVDKLSDTTCKHFCQKVRQQDDKQFDCFRLSHRTLLKIQGQDTGPFLQGIITNDMGLLIENEHKAMYTHMLNVQGRTLYDLIIYSLRNVAKEDGGVLLECDSSLSDSIQRHLKVYKIRRKVNISPCPNLSLWAVLPSCKAVGEEKPNFDLTAPEKALVWQADPRTEAMGWRLVLENQVTAMELIEGSRQGEIEEYHRHRYSIGLPEGAKDLPHAVALPLESNLVYMQGISFSKGCYIGQELTARTHHTGVVRKRLMPVSLSAAVEGLQEGLPLLGPQGKPAGKHRSGLGEQGLALVRLAHAGEPLTLQSPEGRTVTVKVSMPDWWPKGTKSK